MHLEEWFFIKVILGVEKFNFKYPLSIFTIRILFSTNFINYRIINMVSFWLFLIRLYFGKRINISNFTIF